jgi:hypothetical protein
VRFNRPLKATTTHSHPRYGSSFGYPLARALGIGYIQEMVARLTHAPIERHNSSTNSTLDDSPTTFPLDHNLYVDATHEVVVLNGKFESSHNPLILSNFRCSYYCSQFIEFRGEWAVTHRPHSGTQVISRVRACPILDKYPVPT